MTALIITRNLPPLVGGMERLNWHMIQEIGKGCSVAVIAPEEAIALLPKNAKGIGIKSSPIWRFLAKSFFSAIKHALFKRPKVILGGSGLVAPAVTIAASLCGATSVVYVHGLDVAVKHALYRAIWIPLLARADLIVANSHKTAVLCHERGIPANKVRVVHPGVSMPAPRTQLESKINDFQSRHSLANRTVLMSVGRLTTRKGILEFVKCALPTIVAKIPGAVLVVIGDTAQDSLLATSQSPESIMEAARANGIENHLLFVGKITNQEELSAAYYSADVHVFPVRTLANDPEGFGMVAVEAAAHGLPTVAFATGGIVDAVKPGSSGFLAEPENYTDLSDKIIITVKQRESLKNTCTEFAKGFEWSIFGEQIRHLLNLPVSTSPEKESH